MRPCLLHPSKESFAFSPLAPKKEKRKVILLFFAAPVVQLAQSNSGLFHFRRAAFSSQLKGKVGSTLAKDAALRVNLNIDGAPITSRTHTHPSHSQTSRLLTSSLSLGVPVPHGT